MGRKFLVTCDQDHEGGENEPIILCLYSLLKSMVDGRFEVSTTPQTSCPCGVEFDFDRISVRLVVRGSNWFLVYIQLLDSLVCVKSWGDFYGEQLLDLGDPELVSKIYKIIDKWYVDNFDNFDNYFL